MKDFLVKPGAHWMVMSLLVSVAGCGTDSPTDDGDNPVLTTSVDVVDFDFTPLDIQASPGATVTWTWNGSEPHNVTFASGGVAAPSATQTTGTFQVTLPIALEVFTYQCTVHPDLMNGSVTVR